MTEFLNPKSMLTPGVAGGLVMLIVNGLALPFPELPARYVALGLSAVVGAIVVFKTREMGVLERVAYWVVNSLVIFVVGFGTNGLGREAAGVAGQATARAPFVKLLPSAYAQEPKPPAGATEAAKKEPSSADAKPAAADARKLEAELETLRAENARLKAKEEAARKQATKSFFKRW